jgi:hypothetical protein
LIVQGDPVLPLWLVAPLAGVTMVLVAGHLLALRAGRARIPASRYRIRSVNGGMMLALVPLLGCAFGVVSPDDQKLFVLLWLTCSGLLGIVVVLALLDGLNNYRLGRRAAEAARNEHLVFMAMVRREVEASRAAEERGEPGGADRRTGGGA